MKIDTLCIRNARESDIDAIFWILHSESIPWDTGKIGAGLDNLYVMTYGDELICVVYGSSNGDRPKTEWAAVHPIYPDGLISGAAYNLLNYFSNLSYNEQQNRYCKSKQNI